jgi:hypothetical protein
MFKFVTQISIPRAWLVRNGRHGFIDCHYRLPPNIKLLQVINEPDLSDLGINDWLIVVLQNKPTKLRSLQMVVVVKTMTPKRTRSGNEEMDSASDYEDDTDDDEEEKDFNSYLARARSTRLKRLVDLSTWRIAKMVNVKIKVKAQRNIADELASNVLWVRSRLGS